MPKMMPLVRDNARADAPVSSSSPESCPLVISKLESISPSSENTARLTHIPGRAWQWLKNRLCTEKAPPLPAKMALADLLRENPALSAEDEKESEVSSCGYWLKAGVTLTLLSAAGAMAWGLSRRPENALSHDSEMLNSTGLSPLLPAEQAFPQALALAGYAGPTRTAGGTRLQERVALLNATRDRLLTRFPGMGAVPTEELLVGPLLQTLTTSAAWRDVSKAELEEQLTRLVDVMLSTLSVQEHLQLYQFNRTAEDDVPFAARFMIHNGQGHVPLNQRTYPLRTTAEGTPFITAMDGRCHFIRYNQRRHRWEYVREADNEGYSAQGRKFQKRYRVAPENLPHDTKISYHPEHDYAAILSGGWIYTWGVFITGNFIPTWSHRNVKGEMYTSLDCGNVRDQQLIIKGDYGWAFERPSVRMDDYLKALLNNVDRGVENNFDKSIGAIREEDGLCADRAGKTWLKKDNRYYRADREGNAITLPDYADARAEYKNGVIRLKSAAEMIFALDTASVRNSIIRSGPFKIEAAALDHLQKHALTTTAEPADLLTDYHPGLAEGDDYSTMLVVNNRKYAVREYTDGYIRVENRNNPHRRDQDIVLWPAGDTLLRVRNGQPDIAYQSLPVGYIATSGADNKQIPVILETAIYKQLEQAIKYGQTFDFPPGDNLIPLKELDLPIGWYDRKTRKSWFLYHGHYFPATFTDAGDENNPCGLNIMHVYAREDFYHQQKLISSLILEEKGDRTEIKTPNSLLSEKLRVSADIARLYHEKLKWRNVPDIRAVEGYVSEAVANGKSRLPQLTTITTNEKLWETQAQRRVIKRQLFPGRVNEKDLEFFKFSAENKMLIPGEEKMYAMLENTFYLIKNEMLPTLDKAMYYAGPDWPIIKNYLHKAMGDINEELLSDISVAWSERLRFIAGGLNNTNVDLVYANEVTLKQREKMLGNRVFVSPNGKHVYINAQKLNPDDPAQIRLVSELLPALANPASSGGNFLFFRQLNGMYLPLTDASEAVIASLKAGKFTPEQQRFLLAESRQYLQRVPSYRRRIETLLAPAKLAYLATYDPAYRAHLFLSSPAFVTLLSCDAYYLLARAEKNQTNTNPWLQQYGELRASVSPVLIEEIDEAESLKPAISLTTPSTTSSSTSTTEAAKTHVHMPEAPHHPHRQHQPDGNRASEVNGGKKQQKVVETDVEEDVRTHSGRVSGPGSTEVEAPPFDEESIEISGRENFWREPESDEETEFGSVEEGQEAEEEEVQVEEAEEAVENPQPEPDVGQDAEPRRAPPVGIEDEVIIRPDRLPAGAPVPAQRRPVPGVPFPPVPVPAVPVPAPPVPLPAPPLPRPGRPLPPAADPVPVGREVKIIAAGTGVAAGVGVGVAIGVKLSEQQDANMTTTGQPTGEGVPSTTYLPGNKTTTGQPTGEGVPSTTSLPGNKTTTGQPTGDGFPSTTSVPGSKTTTGQPTGEGFPSTTSVPGNKTTTGQPTGEGISSTTSLPGNKTFPNPDIVEKYHKDKLHPVITLNDTTLVPEESTSAAVVTAEPVKTTPVPEEKVWVPGHGNVTVVTIPGLECLGEKTVSASEILRLVGHALQRPVVANALAWQEIKHLDLYGTCPALKDVESLEKDMDVIDAVINTVMMIPRFWPVFVLKTLVGPILEMIANDVDGIHAPLSERIYLILNALTQIMALRWAKGFIPKSAIKSNPYKPFIPVKIRKMFNFDKDGKLTVKVEGKEYPLDVSFDDLPVITDSEGHTRFIDYNQQEEHWDFSNGIEQQVIDEAERNLYKYRQIFTGLVEEPGVEVNDDDIVTLKIKNRPEITGVFIGADFVPARSEKIGNEVVAYTTSSTVTPEEQRLLINNKYGWQFERSSVKKEINLELLLRRKTEAGITIAQKPIGAIHDSDGFSYDSHGEAYIKHDYKYYKVIKINAEQSPDTLKLVDFNDAQVRYSNGYFTLENADEFLFATKTEKVEYNAEKFRIEKAALEYLRKNALTFDEYLPERIGPGIYQDTAGTVKVFEVNNDKFVISEHTDQMLKIKPADGKSEPVVLWKNRNTWFRVRNASGKKPLDFTDVTYCRATRSPTGGLCAKISMETRLHNKLLQEVFDNTNVINMPARENLKQIRSHDIPYLFEDPKTLKTYFMFGDRFFNAKVLEASDPDNPTEHPCLKVTGRSDFYRAEKNIETIVMTDEGNVLKMTGMPTYIAEKLGITPDETIQYIKKVPFNDIENIEVLEQLTNDILQAESIYVEPPGSEIVKPKSQLPIGELLTEAKRALFPELLSEGKEGTVYSYDLSYAVKSSSSTLRDTGEFVSQQVSYVFNDLLNTAINSLKPGNYNHPVAEDYLIEILKKNENNFLHDVERSLRKRLEGARDELSKRQIRLLTAYKNPEEIPVLTGKNTDQMIFIHEEDSGSIFINMDELTARGKDKPKSRDAVTTVLVRSLLQSSGQASHIIELPMKNGIFTNIKNAYKYAQVATRHSKLDESSLTKMNQVIARYLENSPVYEKHLEQMAGMPADARKFGYLLRYDPGFRAHITLNSDDFVTLIAHDLHYQVSSSQMDTTILHPWVKRYGLLRGVMRNAPDITQDVESIINSRVEIARLARLQDTFEIASPDPQNRNMFTSHQNNRYLRWQGNYYPVEFLGKSGRVISVGSPQEMRQIYYYNPQHGTLFPVQPRAARMNTLTYHSDLDVFERKDPWSDFTEIAKYDTQKNVLVPTGATRIFRLPGKVTRIEFPWFNLYHPEGAPLDIYVVGHGKALDKGSIIPKNTLLHFYIEKGQQVVPYKGNVEDLLSATFSPKQILGEGQEVENYVLKPFTKEPVNNLYLSRKYNKNVVQIFSKSTRLTSLTESLSSFFLDDKINIHLYTCRAVERPDIVDIVEGYNNINVQANIEPNAENMNRRWAFDQQVESGERLDEGTLTGFLPLREQPVFLHYGTIEAQLNDLLAHDYKDVPYEIFYSLDISTYASKRIPPYLLDARLQLRGNVVKAQRTLDSALAKLNDEDYDFEVRKYLSDAFENYMQGDIPEEVVKRLKVNIKRASDFLHESSQSNYNNIGIVSSRQIPNPDSPGTYHSAVPENIRERMPLAFTLPGDAFRRLFVMEDALSPIEEHGKIIDPKEHAQEHIIIHESSHITSKTTDILYSYTDTSQPPRLDEPGDALKRLNEMLDKGQIRGTPLWFDFMPLYYRQFGIKEPMKEEVVVKLIKESPMLKANILMENADSFALLVQGIAKLKKSNIETREDVEAVIYSDYQYLGMIFTATREHHLNREP